MDGIKFASALEKYCYLALKKEKLFEQYEGERFTLLEGFFLENEVYERQSNGKGEYTKRGGKKILGERYTPDFTSAARPGWTGYIIECKGRANERFPSVYKRFKNWLRMNDDKRPLFKPQNQKECDETVQLILNMNR